MVIKPAEESELDEMWSFVQKKENQLWHAIDHLTGSVLAYVFGSRKDIVFEQLKSLLEPFGIKRFYSDDWGALIRKITDEEHIISKKNTQKIERKHLTLRTRIKRLTKKPFVFQKQKKCTMRLLDCLLIDMNFIKLFEKLNNRLKTLPKSLSCVFPTPTPRRTTRHR